MEFDGHINECFYPLSMKKLVDGILDFRKRIRPGVRDTFAKLALGQKPDALFIACSDSRVAANVFASTDPGDLFVIRNVGNMVPFHGEGGSVAAGIEFAILNLEVKDIIVCGHSECGAMQALVLGRDHVTSPHLKNWLRHGDKGIAEAGDDHNRLSQLNVLQQIENLKSYTIIQERLKKGKLRIHGWWFELATATVLYYEPSQSKFIEIDEETAARAITSVC